MRRGVDLLTVKELDQFRYKRNDSKYHGIPIFMEDAKVFIKAIKEVLK